MSWTSVDITDPEAVTAALAETRPSSIFHCAGIADVHSTWSDSATALRVNVMGTHNLLTALERLGLDVPVLVTGSALVYRPSETALSEDAPIGPTSPYGVSKLAQELVGLAARGRVIVTRPFNHAGPRQAPAYVTSSFARQIAEVEAGLREPVLEVGNLDARRDITDVRDTVRAYRLLMEKGQAGRPYNVCSGEAFRVGDLLAVAGEPGEGPDRSQRPIRRGCGRTTTPVVLGDPSRLRHDTGWTPRIPIERTLARSPRLLAAARLRQRPPTLTRGSPYSETMRQWVHIGFGAVALLLPFLHWYQAVVLAACAVVFNISLLRRIAGDRLHRPVELAQTIPAGLVLYPTSILLLLLMLPARLDIVAAAWGILAAGDGAATLVGRRYGRRRWPWNREKSVAGSAALVIAGGAAGAFLCWWCRPVIIPPPYLWFSIGAPIAAALVAAAVETVPIRLDDNLSVPLTRGDRAVGGCRSSARISSPG